MAEAYIRKERNALRHRIPKPQVPGATNRIILKRIAVLMALFGVLVFVPLLYKPVSYTHLFRSNKVKY